MREMQNQWSLLCRVRGVSFQGHGLRTQSQAEVRRRGTSCGQLKSHIQFQTHSKIHQGQDQNKQQDHLSFTKWVLYMQWHGLRGEPRWSPFLPILCCNFRGLFPNPFKWTFHLSASFSFSAIPTVQAFLHHFQHKLMWSLGQNKRLWEMCGAHAGVKGDQLMDPGGARITNILQSVQ